MLHIPVPQGTAKLQPVKTGTWKNLKNLTVQILMACNYAATRGTRMCSNSDVPYLLARWPRTWQNI